MNWITLPQLALVRWPAVTVTVTSHDAVGASRVYLLALQRFFAGDVEGGEDVIRDRGGRDQFRIGDVTKRWKGNGRLFLVALHRLRRLHLRPQHSHHMHSPLTCLRHQRRSQSVRRAERECVAGAQTERAWTCMAT
jgi:hypothetical protein